jgi:hypothetical protein
MARVSLGAWGSIIAVLLTLLGFYLGLGRLFILILVALFGYVVGKLLESSERRARLRELFSDLFNFR